MKVRTMDEIQADPARVRVSVDIDLSGVVGTAAQANRIQVLEGELADERQRRARDLELVENQRGEALALLQRVREAVWSARLDESMEKRHVEDVITRDASFLAEAVAFVRASVGQP